MIAEAPTSASTRLAAVLAAHTAPAELCRTEGDKIRCVACGHRCLIGPGRHGICRVRFNENGQLRVPFGYVGALASDPVEKKPFNHVLPGTDALTFGMLGCDFHCGYCQNWVTSQALRDDAALAPIQEVTAAQLVRTAQRTGARLVVSSYNEPLITAEWAAAVFREAAPAGLLCAFVSNGNATAEALDLLKPWIRAYKIDFKSFNDRRYRELGGTLEHVMDGIRLVHERGIWLEIVTLLVSGFNDDETELREMAKFLASLSLDIPWHITAFHPDYKMMEVPQTTARQLARVAEIGVEAGLRFVYAGNAPGRVGEWENTRCPQCRGTLIERYGYAVQSYRLTAAGRCPDCDALIPGIWHAGGAHDVPAGTFYSRVPRRVTLN
jgi:pyruvate formate lyase activating enzyme